MWLAHYSGWRTHLVGLSAWISYLVTQRRQLVFPPQYEDSPTRLRTFLYRLLSQLSSLMPLLPKLKGVPTTWSPLSPFLSRWDVVSLRQLGRTRHKTFLFFTFVLLIKECKIVNKWITILILALQIFAIALRKVPSGMIPVCPPQFNICLLIVLFRLHHEMHRALSSLPRNKKKRERRK